MDADVFTKRIVVAITGASGSIYGIRLVERLAELPDVETHLIISAAGALTMRQETDVAPGALERLVEVVHRPRDVGASLASGSFRTEGMVVAPCSIKTLSAIANCYSADLVARAADVTLKEGRPLILAVRETPLHQGHLALLAQAGAAGAIIAPPVPAFYHGPETIDDLVDHYVSRVLSRLGLRSGQREWTGTRKLSPFAPSDPRLGPGSGA
jgi:flavin prenyltransferase